MINHYLNVMKNYAKSSGRASRSEYWYFVLANFLVGIGLGVFAAITKIHFLAPIYQLGILIPSVAVGVRRFHDTGRSGWLLLVPIYNFVVLCTAGVEGLNEYGPDPKGGHPMPHSQTMTSPPAPGQAA